MNQLQLGDNFYVNAGTVGRFCELVLAEAKYESGNPGVAPKGRIPFFLSFILFYPQFDSLLGLEGLTVVRLMRTKNTGYAWLSPATDYLHDLMVAYLTNARLVTVTRSKGYVSWGVYNTFLSPVHD